eukprot:TRINITY_DN31583_c0_g1_i1.p1 TRINITY_DN31583_c0_g1~~TRINITY_DN31583_c0_g1_i1.p1  ORF type:complete len:421 (-),score=79.59 TRINITY_DN31583_c0_g1_i1:32-1294(-)
MPVFERQSFLSRTTADALGQLQGHVKAGLDKAYREMMKDLIIDAEKSCSFKDKSSSRSPSPRSRKHKLQRCKSAPLPLSPLSRGGTSLSGGTDIGRRSPSGRNRLLPELLRSGEIAASARRPATVALAASRPTNAAAEPLLAAGEAAFPTVARAGNRPGTAAAGSLTVPKPVGSASNSSRAESKNSANQAGTAFLNSQNSSKHTERLPQIVWVARANNLSFETCKQASELFRRFTSFPDGFLSREQFRQVLCFLLETKSVDDKDVDKAFGMVAKDRQGDKMNFSEFALWYSTSSFDEKLCVGDDEKVFRLLCRKYNMDMRKMDKYRRLFGSADADGSGTIEEEEFVDLLRKCAKVPGHVDIPASRFRQLWKECDADGSGSVEFEEFLTFYSRYFEDSGTGVTGFESFYRNIRPALGSGSR